MNIWDAKATGVLPILIFLTIAGYVLQSWYSSARGRRKSSDEDKTTQVEADSADDFSKIS